jgi:hypothetical protein
MPEERVSRLPGGLSGDSVVLAVIAGVAITQLAIGLSQAFAPRFFFDQIGPFGVRNDHYIRDNASWTLAVGLALLVSLRRATWRVPLLAFITLEFALHAINHLVDIGKAHPKSAGVTDFVSLAIGAAVLGWALLRAIRDERS